MKILVLVLMLCSCESRDDSVDKAYQHRTNDEWDLSRVGRQ